MRLSGFVLVCLYLTALASLGCGPGPTVKQPDTSNNTASTSSASTTSVSPPPTASAMASSSSGSSGPGPSATASATTAPTSSTTPPDSQTALVGTLTSAEIQGAVNANLAAFDACYTLGADKQGKLEGTVTLKATVNPLGIVRDLAVVKSTLKNPKVDTCVADAFKKIKFPQPKGGVAIITYPMTFGGEVVIKKK